MIGGHTGGTQDEKKSRPPVPSGIILHIDASDKSTIVTGLENDALRIYPDVGSPLFFGSSAGIPQYKNGVLYFGRGKERENK